MNSTNEAPERIWVAPDENDNQDDWGNLDVGESVYWEGFDFHKTSDHEGLIGYIRSDIVAKTVAEVREGFLKSLASIMYSSERNLTFDEIAQAIREGR